MTTVAPTASSGSDSAELTFQIAYINFSKEGFHIVKTTNGDSVKGKFNAIEGHYYESKGKWGSHPTYGPFFEIETACAIVPKTPEALGRFLAIQMKGTGVGQAVIGMLVDACGSEGLDLEKLLDTKDMEVLIDCVGKRNAKKIEILLDKWPKIKPAADLISPLLGYGFSPAMADQLVAMFAKAAVERVERDPYSLIPLIDGLSFLTADRIAMRVGKTGLTDPLRLRAALATGIRDATSNGDIGVKRNLLIKRTMPLVNEAKLEGGRRKLVEGVPLVVSEALLEETLEAMVSATAEVEGESRESCNFARQLIQAPDEKGEMVIWYRPLVEAEENIARRIAALEAPCDAVALAMVEKVAADMGAKLHVDQLNAVKMAVTHPFSIITGGPGMGKSFLLKVLMKVLDLSAAMSAGGSSGYRWNTGEGLLCAPTGNAAKRMRQATGRMAKTVHGQMGWTGGKFAAFNHAEPLNARYVVLDEASMADTEACSVLLDGIHPTTRVIVMGDIDQLSSVGPGQVLRDLMRSGLVPVTRLTKTYRFSGGIAEAAQQIRNGIMPTTTEDKQFQFIETETPAQDLLDKVKEMIKSGINPDDIQILSPTNKGNAGCTPLNLAMQSYLNPEAGTDTAQRLRRDDGDVLVGDRVVQLRNDRDLGLVNGDIGWVDSIPSGDGNVALSLIDTDKPVLVPRASASHLKLAYATTVHKSQGAEAPYILLALDPGSVFMLTRELVYTGVTRGKEGVLVFSSASTFARAVRKGQPPEGTRRTGLVSKLKAAMLAVGKGLPVTGSDPTAATGDDVTRKREALMRDAMALDIEEELEF